MNYLINKHIFNIKQNSTLPILKYPLYQKIREVYDITDDMLKNIAITFSMFDRDSGRYIIANNSANMVINRDKNNYLDETEYTLVYKFNKQETTDVGIFSGEFCLDFIGEYSECGKIKLPLNDFITINITNSITKTTII